MQAKFNLCAPYDLVTAVLLHFLRVNAQMCNLDLAKNCQYLPNVVNNFD
jgi:hypothetical protein